MKLKSLVTISMVFFLVSCASTPPAPTLTPAEIQSMQTRQYDESKDTVFASVISVFQDLGYQIEAADLATGIITSQSAAANDAAYVFRISENREIDFSRNNIAFYISLTSIPFGRLW